jgi:predicted signal transduction protein with EAL and GGDEF domain
MKEAMRSKPVEMPTGRTINLNASFGVATFPGDAEDAQSLIAVADRAMYADKRLSHQAQVLSGKENTIRREDDAVSSAQTLSR